MQARLIPARFATKQRIHPEEGRALELAKYKMVESLRDGRPVTIRALARIMHDGERFGAPDGGRMDRRPPRLGGVSTSSSCNALGGDVPRSAARRGDGVQRVGNLARVGPTLLPEYLHDLHLHSTETGDPHGCRLEGGVRDTVSSNKVNLLW